MFVNTTLHKVHGLTFRQVQKIVPDLPQNLMTLIFHLYASQELYQSTEQTYQELTQLEGIFPGSQFLKTQRALLYYHAKGQSTHIFNESSKAN